MTRRLASALAIACLAPAAWAQEGPPPPHLGYAVPAGGQRGTVVRAFVGGQSLNRVDAVHVTGVGAHARVVRYLGRFRPLDRHERQELLRRVAALRATRAGGAAPAAEDPPADGDAKATLRHPLLDRLEDLAPDELEFLVNGFLRLNRKTQPNAQIAETVLVEVTLDADAALGDRELRLATPLGLTNPIRFQVGELREVPEPNPWDERAPDPPPQELPVCFNGQIKPGDVDRVAFRARQGQRLVVDVAARHLVPFLADAVPGWFQATITLLDAHGRELAYADRTDGVLDPVLRVEVPADGVYRLEIRDALWRGREDFVYRIRVGELPYITSMFPLGGRAGAPVVARIEGWNLGTDALALDTDPAGAAERTLALVHDGRRSNAVHYAVGTEPEVTEVEPDGAGAPAPVVTLPVVVNGRIATPGDRDAFRFQGRAGQDFEAEVHARRLGSRLDSLLRVTDAAGTVLAWNDDAVDKRGVLHREPGEQTHHADSRVLLRLPADGWYRVEVLDAQGQGGPDCAYRLVLGPPRADFELVVTPASLTLRAGLSAAIDVHVRRHGGFAGPVDLRLAGAPEGFGLSGGRIPAGCDRIRVTVDAPARALPDPVALAIEGTADAGAGPVTRRAIPAEDAMQAFLWRHLAPAQALVASVARTRFPFRPPQREGTGPVELASGRTVAMCFRVPPLVKALPLHYVLREPPAGVTLERTTLERGLLTLWLAAAPEAPPSACVDNLIVEIHVDLDAARAAARGREKPADDTPADAADPKKERRQAKRGDQPRRILAGVLPAIPCTVVAP